MRELFADILYEAKPGNDDGWNGGLELEGGDSFSSEELERRSEEEMEEEREEMCRRRRAESSSPQRFNNRQGCWLLIRHILEHCRT